MTTRRRIPRANRFIIGVLAAVLVAVGAEARGDETAINEATAQFYSALDALFAGDVAPMKEVWSHRDDVTYMGPGGGFEVGWGPVLATWEKQAAMKLGGSVRPTDIHVTLGSELAVVSVVERGENTNADGKAATVSIRATNLFRKENGTWKMIGHHTDPLPFLHSPPQVSSAQ